MGSQERFPAYGGRGPEAMRLGIALTAIATILIVLRIYVRLRINKFGTAALVWALLAWVSDQASVNSCPASFVLSVDLLSVRCRPLLS